MLVFKSVILAAVLCTAAEASPRDLTAIGNAVQERYGRYYSTGTYGHVHRIEADLVAGVATVEWHHGCLGTTPRTMCARLAAVVRDPRGVWRVRELRRWTLGVIPDGVDPWKF